VVNICTLTECSKKIQPVLPKYQHRLRFVCCALKVVNWLPLSGIQVQVQHRVAVINYTFKLFATLHFGKAHGKFGSAADVDMSSVALAATTAAFKVMPISIIFYSFASN